MKKRVAVTVLSFLSGCSTIGSEYNCGVIARAGCAPVTSVYKQTHTKDEYREGIGKTKIRLKPVKVMVGQNAKTLESIAPGDPLLSKPTVMRVLYSSFENTEGDLDAGGYIYLKMQESSWLVER